MHRFALALLRARAGRQEEALAALEPLQQELAATKQETRLSRATAQLLAQLRKLPGR